MVSGKKTILGGPKEYSQVRKKGRYGVDAWEVTFPKDVQRARRSSRGLTRIDEVPQTPRIPDVDIEKGHSELTSFEMSEPPKQSKWAKRLGDECVYLEGKNFH